MSLVNSTSTQHHSMFLETESNRLYDELSKRVHEALVRELLETEAGQVKLADSKVSKEDSGSGSGSGCKGAPWTDDEHLEDHSMFLATESNRGFEDQLGDMIGGNTVHEAPVRELVETEVGQLVNDSKVDSKEDAGSSSGAGVGKGRKKVIPWTDDEHLKFLQGLKKFGKGAWDRISKEAVITKTPKQVTSHAQKYYLRQDNNNKKKRRSIHDVTLVDVQTPTTPSSSSSVAPTPSIEDIAATTTMINVQVEPPLALATAGFNDTIVKAGKGVLSTPSHPNYLHDYYTTAQPHPVTLPMNYYCQVAGEAPQAFFNLYDHSQGGEVHPPVGASSLYDHTGKGKGVVAESTSNYLSCDGHYYYGGQVEARHRPLPMNHSFSGGQAAGEPLPMNYCQASQPVFNLYDIQGGGEEVQPPLGTSLYHGQCFGGQGEAGPQPLPMNYSFSGGQAAGESSFNLYDSTQGEPLPMNNYCQVPGEASQPLFNLYDTNQEEGSQQTLPMNNCQVPQTVNLDDTTQAGEGGTTFCDDDEAIAWLLNEYSSYDNNSCYYYSSDCY